MDLNSIRTVALAAAAALALGGCPQPDSPAAAMQAYWDAIKLSDWQTAWSMEQAAILGTDDPYQYYRRMQAAWPIIELELGAPLIDGRDAEVGVEAIRALPILDRSVPKRQSLIDRWVWADGRWWHLETTEQAASPAAPGADPPPTAAASADRAAGAERHEKADGEAEGGPEEGIAEPDRG